MLLHPLDFLGVEDDVEMKFFPGMTVAREKKLELLDEVLTQITARFRLVPMRDHAAELIARSGMRIPAAQPAQFEASLAGMAETVD